MRSITENTLVPLGLVIIALTAVVWLTTLNARSESTASELLKLETKQDSYQKTLDEVNQRLSNIEGKLGVRDDR